MAGSVTIPNVFQAQAGPIPLAQLDTDLSTLATAVNTAATFQNYYVDSGAVNSIVVTIAAPTVFTYVAGVALDVKISVTNTGATVINVNALGSKAVTNSDGTALVANQLLGGQVAKLIYDGTQFQLYSVTTGAAATFKQLTIGPPASGTAATIIGLSGANPLIVNGAGSTTASQTLIYEPQYSIAATQGVATVSSGQFTGTFTGLTTSPTCQVRWSRCGGIVSIGGNTGAGSGTSNASTFTVTGMPASLSTAIPNVIWVSGYFGGATDNGSTNQAFVVTIQGAVIEFLKVAAFGNTGSGWTSSGTKAVPNNWALTYILD